MLPKVVSKGDELQARGERITLHGPNDTVMFPCKCLYLRDIGGTQYLTRNNLFTKTPEGDLPAANLDEFFWRYFWLMKSYYGMNLLRTSDGWGYGVMRELFYNYPTSPGKVGSIKWHALMDSMLKMASWAGVYISFGLGSPQGYSSTATAAEIAAWEANNAYKLDSPKYLEYVKFQKDVLSSETVRNSSAIAIVEYANEPDGDWPYLHWWKTRPEGAEVAWHEWANRLVNDIRAADHSHLDTIGTCAGAYFHGYGEDAFKAANDHPCDLTHQHIYGRRITYDWTDSDYFARAKRWASDLGKPLYMGEYGYDCWQKCEDPINPEYGTYHYYLPVEYGGKPYVRTSYAQIYSKWDRQVLSEIGCDAMAFMMIPYYPHWPPSDSVLMSIPSVPIEDPNPDVGVRTVDADAYQAMLMMLK